MTENSLPIVASAPYSWPIGGKWSLADTAAICIDMQNDFLSPDGYFASLGEANESIDMAAENTKELLALLRATSIRLIHTREGHEPGLSDLSETKKLRAIRVGAAIGSVGPMGRLLVRGEPGWDFAPGFDPAANEPVVDKAGNSAFYQTELDDILRDWGVKHLILFGVTTDVCVSSTMRDANERGIDCLLISDCCGAAEDALHDAVLNGLNREGGIFGAHATRSDLAKVLE
nr:isochorismatase family cysteine hydrolase [uncultured Ruegeria sp.]